MVVTPKSGDSLERTLAWIRANSTVHSTTVIRGASGTVTYRMLFDDRTDAEYFLATSGVEGQIDKYPPPDPLAKTRRTHPPKYSVKSSR